MARDAVGSAEPARVATFAKVNHYLVAIEVKEPGNPRLSLLQASQPDQEGDIAKKPPSAIGVTLKLRYIS